MINLHQYGFTEEDTEWRFEAYFSGVENFKDNQSHDLKNYVDVDIEMYNETTDFEKPQPFQKNALNYFHENQDVVLSALCKGVIEHLPNLIALYGDGNIPELKNITDVKNHISIDVIHVLAEEKDGFSYLGFNCGCTWDEEHGLGIVLHKHRVIDIGDADTASLSYECILQDKMTEEAWETYKEEKRIAANNANAINEREESLQSALGEIPKKWWQFWK